MIRDLKLLLALFFFPAIAYLMSSVDLSDDGPEYVLQWLQLGTISAAILGAVLYGFVCWIGYRVRKPNANVARLLRASLYSTFLGGALLLPLHCALIVGSLWVFFAPIPLAAMYYVYCFIPLGIIFAIIILTAISLIGRGFLQILRPPVFHEVA